MGRLLAQARLSPNDEHARSIRRMGRGEPMRNSPFRSAGSRCPRSSMTLFTPPAGMSSTSPTQPACFVWLSQTGWATLRTKTLRGANRPSGQVSSSKSKRRTCLSMPPAPVRRPAPRALSPQDLASWLCTTRDAKESLFQWQWPAIRISERRELRALVVLLADELYRRERGSVPPTEERAGRSLSRSPAGRRLERTRRWNGVENR